jgi:hypothetical protein
MVGNVVAHEVRHPVKRATVAEGLIRVHVLAASEERGLAGLVIACV